jgi:GTP-binding protein
MFLEPFEAVEAYATVRAELLAYKDNLALKKEIVCITKIDAMSEEEISKFKDALEAHIDRKVMVISSVSGRNLDKLKILMFKTKEVDSDK